MKDSDLAWLVCSEAFDFNPSSISRLEKKLKGEDKIHRSIIKFLQCETMLSNLRGIWFHVPNEFSGKKNSLFGMKLTLLGRIKGAPDLIFIAPHKTLCIEIKKENGLLSTFQKLFASWCRQEKIDYYVIKSKEELHEILIEEEFL